MAKKRNVAKTVFKAIGITLLIGLAVAVICYFAVPEFKTWVNNSWEDLKFQIENSKETTEAVKRLVIKQ